MIFGKDKRSAPLAPLHAECGYRHDGGPCPTVHVLPAGLEGNLWADARRKGNRGGQVVKVRTAEQRSASGRAARRPGISLSVIGAESPRLRPCAKCRKWRIVNSIESVDGWTCGECKLRGYRGGRRYGQAGGLKVATANFMAARRAL